VQSEANGPCLTNDHCVDGACTADFSLGNGELDAYLTHLLVAEQTQTNQNYCVKRENSSSATTPKQAFGALFCLVAVLLCLY
jgi:hypothetical protein